VGGGGGRSAPPGPGPLRLLGGRAEAAAPIMATTRSAGLPLHFEHLPERFGLLVILVLGESIAAIAVGVHETHWEPVTVTVAALGFVVAVSLWWTYFDLAGQQPRTSWPIVAATAAPCCTTSTPTGIGRSPWGWPRQGRYRRRHPGRRPGESRVGDPLGPVRWCGPVPACLDGDPGRNRWFAAQLPRGPRGPLGSWVDSTYLPRHCRCSGWVAASGEGCRQTGFGPTCPPRRARSQRPLPEAATVRGSLGTGLVICRAGGTGLSERAAGVQ
jgi:hypothetical protein